MTDIRTKLLKGAKRAYLGAGSSLTHNPLADLKWFFEQEADSWVTWMDIPPAKRLWYWRHGFTSPTAKLYDIDTYGPDAFVSELQRNKLFASLNGAHRYLIDDKLSQHWMLADYPETRPEAYGFLDHGHVHGIPGTEFEGGARPVAEWLPEALRTHEKLVVKHLRGEGGKEVFVYAYDGTDGFQIDGEPVSEADLCAAAAELSGYLVSAFVTQHAYADDLYPHATNTMRFFTLWDDEAGELLVPAAVHRIGTEASRPIDNFSIGGIASWIDLETGTLGPAAQIPLDGGDVPWYSTHPDTGAQIEGVTVPHWQAIRETVERLALENTYIPAIGWDILLDESGEPVVLEANTGTGFDLIQVHRPLLADERVAAVASRHLRGVDHPSAVRAAAHRIRAEAEGSDAPNVDEHRNGSLPRQSP
jgi:hypothetical protein